MVRYRRKNTIQNTLKDYIVPIIGGVIIILILISLLRRGGGEELTVIAPTSSGGTQIEFLTSTTDAYIMYPGDNKEQITENNALYPGETLIVKEGMVSIFPEDGSKITLNKIAELRYNADTTFSLFSSDVWLNTTNERTVSMRYASVDIAEKSIVSLTQNEAGSTIYVLKGSAKISNLVGVSTLLAGGQKITISRLNAGKDDIDISTEKTAIDSFFKESDWFIENGGHLISTQLSNDEGENEQNSQETGISGNIETYYSLNSLEDEMKIETSPLAISGSILDESVANIRINGKDVAINPETNSFSLEHPLSARENDIVIKVYDSEENILEKDVFTVYNVSQSLGTTANSATTFGVNANDFRFTAPSTSGKFTTTAREITLRGITSAEDISKVEVNGFELASFNGSTWRYHAFERFSNLSEGTNQYKVDYFGEDGSIIYTDYFTIVLQARATPTTTAPVNNTNNNETLISDEA